MKIRPGVPGDSARVAELIASFQPQLTLEPSGVGAEQYLASVSEDSERAYLGSHRYAYIVAEHGRVLAGFIAVRDRSHVFHLFVATQYQGLVLTLTLSHRGPATQFCDMKRPIERIASPGEAM